MALALPAEVAAALEANLGASLTGSRSVGGGDINDAYVAEVGTERIFVKTRAGAEPGEYEAEAAGLRWLDEGELAVPSVVAVGSSPAFLALQFVEGGTLSTGGAKAFGRGLARMHGLGADSHGWLPGDPGRQRIGSVALETKPSDDWPLFYAEQRLMPLARMAHDHGALEAVGLTAVERLCGRIGDLAGPPEPPARLHGDLWAGNVHADRTGAAWLIDPSAQGGHREMDLAMLRLFGTPGGERVHASYAEVAPLAEGHEERVPLWQLQPLLVHAVLFGGHYGGEAGRVAASYS